MLGPLGFIQTLGDVEHHRGGRWRHAHERAVLRLQRIHVDVLDGLGRCVRPILAASTLTLSDVQPVGRLIGRAGKVLGVDEALHQPRPVAVLRFEVLTQAAQRHAQHARGQVVTAHRGADEKAGHADDAVLVLGARGLVPAEPLVTIGQPQRRRSKTQPTQPAVFRADQVTHLRAHQRPGTLRVLAQQHLVPQAHLLKAIDLDQRQCTHLAGMGRNILGRGHRRFKTPGRLAFATARRCNARQHKMTGLLELAQRFDAACGLRAAASVEKAEMTASRLGKRRTTGVRAVGQQSSDRVNRSRPRQCSLDLALCFHSKR